MYNPSPSRHFARAAISTWAENALSRLSPDGFVTQLALKRPKKLPWAWQSGVLGTIGGWGDRHRIWPKAKDTSLGARMPTAMRHILGSAHSSRRQRLTKAVQSICIIKPNQPNFPKKSFGDLDSWSWAPSTAETPGKLTPSCPNWIWCSGL